MTEREPDSPVAEPATALGRMTPVDLSHPLEPGMTVWPGHPRFEHELLQCYTRGDASRHHRIALGEHTGTHLDAPVRFVPGGADIARTPLRALTGRAAVLRGPAGDTEVTPAALAEFEAAYGPVRPGDFALVDCGWAGRWNTSASLEPWPYVSVELAAALLEREVRMFAVDTPSPDPSDSRACPVHRLLLGADALIGENFTHIDRLTG
ncbi:cyclase family protein [Streptomyces hygroscopicus]|uniref:cyclase family protein n=1 Tax=Streptomyces hygroscopicus TaxID=1912 RepID=UPI0004C50C77|nr:cyclase family protein [Streptomyces hygroscopicus]